MHLKITKRLSEFQLVHFIATVDIVRPLSHCYPAASGSVITSDLLTPTGKGNYQTLTGFYSTKKSPNTYSLQWYSGFDDGFCQSCS